VVDASLAGVNAALGALAEALGSERANAAAVAVACPRLLQLAPRQVQRLVQQAAGALSGSMGREAALRVLLSRGELLAAPPGALHDKWRLLESLARASPA
jgi:hypothetical protein